MPPTRLYVDHLPAGSTDAQWWRCAPRESVAASTTKSSVCAPPIAVVSIGNAIEWRWTRVSMSPSAAPTVASIVPVGDAPTITRPRLASSGEYPVGHVAASTYTRAPEGTLAPAAAY